MLRGDVYNYTFRLAMQSNTKRAKNNYAIYQWFRCASGRCDLEWGLSVDLEHWICADIR